MSLNLQIGNMNKAACLGFAALLATAWSARAQILTVSTPVTDVSSVLTLGSEVFGGSSNGSFTLSNGVSFVYFYNSGTTTSGIPGSTVTVDVDGAGYGNYANLSLSDSTLNNVLNNNLATQGSLFEYITGLTPGQAYVVQTFASMTPSGNINGNGTYSGTETVTYSDSFYGATSGNTGTLSYGQLLPGESGAFSMTATFTAGSAGTAFLRFLNSDNTVDEIAALQIRALPEPSTWLLLAVGIAGSALLLRRRVTA